MSSGNARKTEFRNKKFPFSILLTATGATLVVSAVIILTVTFGPVLSAEVKYNLKQTVPPSSQKKEIIPIDTEFDIVIPKIEANAKVIADVDPYNSRAYQVALIRGVAHAKDTSVPGQPGNVFLFSHSSVNFYEASRYNSIFYLLTKMEFGDEIDVYYQGTKYTYTVTSKTIVPPTAVQYLKSMENGRETLTLMTCWPQGTTFKRLLVIAERKENQ